MTTEDYKTHFNALTAFGQASVDWVRLDLHVWSVVAVLRVGHSSSVYTLLIETGHILEIGTHLSCELIAWGIDVGDKWILVGAAFWKCSTNLTAWWTCSFNAGHLRLEKIHKIGIYAIFDFRKFQDKNNRRKLHLIENLRIQNIHQILITSEIFRKWLVDNWGLPWYFSKKHQSTVNVTRFSEDFFLWKQMQIIYMQWRHYGLTELTCRA